MAENGTSAAAARSPKTETSPRDSAPQKTVQKLNKSVLLSAKTWDIFSPPPSNSLKGKVVPRVVNRFNNRRKLSVEIHRITPLTGEKNESGKEPFSYEECVIRILVPSSKEKEAEAKREAKTKNRLEKGSNQTFQSVREIYVGDDGDDDDTIEQMVGGMLADTGGKTFDGWKPKYRIPCQSITVKLHHKKSVFLYIEIPKLKQEREIIFDTLEDAQKFCNTLEEEHALETARTEKRLQAVLGSIKLPPFETITLLVEIVSGWDLPIGDLSTSDPYVICMLGHREVHRTSYISSTLDPIWTIKTGSLFLLTVESRELFIHDGLNFLVKDYDKLGHNEVLGCVQVPPAVLYKANGERMVFKLQAAPGAANSEPSGHLAVRCRRATDYDKKFMESFMESEKVVAAGDQPASGKNDLLSIISRNWKEEKDGTKKFKIRPSPDPKRVEQTEWMTHEEIEEEVLKPSKHWVDAGSGTLGRIFLEVLYCDSLPNFDTGGFLGNKTDAFAYVVYEDVYARTDTIDDCLSPRWMPWTNRAFILNMSHPSSQISIGVFDFDPGPIDDHDLIGRVSIDMTNLRKDTEYILSYNIFPSARISHAGGIEGRKAQGKVTVRLRLEIPDERRLPLCTLEPPEHVYVNVKKRKDFRVIRQTCLGKYDDQQYSLNTLKSYIDELTEYKNAMFYLEDAVMSLLFWRGHFPLRIGSKEFLLPLHSLNAFIISTLLVENPQYYPSFCFFSIAWILIAVMGHRRNSANVWGKCNSYGEIMQKLILGQSRTPPHNIEPFAGWEGTKRDIEKWIKRIKETEEKAERDYIEAEKAEEERLKELEEIGDTDGDISTKVGKGISIDPIKSVVHPYQLLLGGVCRALRFVKNIITWEESYFAFWVASGSAVLAIACLFVPWFWIIRWTSRITVWTLFGPWMKLVDIFYISTLVPESEGERKTRQSKEKLQKRLMTDEAKAQARLVREDTAKMKKMKKYMYGKFSLKIPTIKEERFVDRPLPESSAVPYQKKAMSLAELAMQEAGYNRTRLPGQNLVGDMIPKAEAESFTAAPVGKATANPDLLARSAPGVGEQTKSDSTALAYVKIGSTVAAAGFLTFFGVPLLASFAEHLVSKLPDSLPDAGASFLQWMRTSYGQ